MALFLAGMANLFVGMGQLVTQEPGFGDVIVGRRGELMLFRLMPFSHHMKKAQAELVVGLDWKLTRVFTHWEAVDRQLPVAHPLVLLEDLTREIAQSMMADLPGLRAVVQEQETVFALARGNYKVLKKQVHEALRLFNCFMRGYRWTVWFGMAQRVPGRGQSYGRWSRAASRSQTLWEEMVKAGVQADAQAPPLTLGDDTTVEQFAELVRRFDAAYWAIVAAEVGLKLARGNLRLAQIKATTMLMAYGHGLRARFGDKGELIKSMPELWPKSTMNKKKKGKAKKKARKDSVGTGRGIVPQRAGVGVALPG